MEGGGCTRRRAARFARARPVPHPVLQFRFRVCVNAEGSGRPFQVCTVNVQYTCSLIDEQTLGVPGSEKVNPRSGNGPFGPTMRVGGRQRETAPYKVNSYTWKVTSGSTKIIRSF